MLLQHTQNTIAAIILKEVLSLVHSSLRPCLHHLSHLLHSSTFTTMNSSIMRAAFVARRMIPRSALSPLQLEASARTMHCVREEKQQNVVVLDQATIQTLSDYIFEMTGRNSRAAKRPNHGSRPCSHVGRRLRRRIRFGTSKLKGKY